MSRIRIMAIWTIKMAFDIQAGTRTKNGQRPRVRKVIERSRLMNNISDAIVKMDRRIKPQRARISFR